MVVVVVVVGIVYLWVHRDDPVVSSLHARIRGKDSRDHFHAH